MKKAFIYPLVIAIVFAGAIMLFTDKTGDIEASSRESNAALISQSLYRAAVTCYANEGAYPATLQYLCENYNISIDETSYLVAYDIFASNILPEITVVEINEE